LGKTSKQTNEEIDMVACHRELTRKKSTDSRLKRKKGQNNV